MAVAVIVDEEDAGECRSLIKYLSLTSLGAQPIGRLHGLARERILSDDISVLPTRAGNADLRFGY